MKEFRSLRKVRKFFSEVPSPDAVFQLTPHFLTGIRILPRERKAGSHFILRLSQGTIQPSFDRKNVTNLSLLERGMREGLERLGLAQGTAAILVPELSARVFILGLESSSLSQKERDRIIRWRIGKQMPALPEDVRFVRQMLVSRSPQKFLVAAVRSAVVGEYEELFSRCRLRVGNVSLPSLSLLNLPSGDEGGDALTVNVEEDSLSLAAVLDSTLCLFRQKSFAFDRTPEIPLSVRLGNLVKEIENTIYFLEDKEKIKIPSVRIRSGLLDEKGDLPAELGRALALPVREIGSRPSGGAVNLERNLLSPLFGQLEWRT